jgi:hypothetical protein
LGVIDQQIIARDPAQPNQASHRRQRPVDEKESMRWLTAMHRTQDRLPTTTRVVGVMDREADSYDLLVASRRPGFDLLVRQCRERNVVDETDALSVVIATLPLPITYRVAVPAAPGRAARTAVVHLGWRAVTLDVPVHHPQRAQCAPITVWVVVATERHPPCGVEPLHWVLLCTWPISTGADAIQAVYWYSLRWRIERYFYTLKEGCQIEASRLQTAAGIKVLLACLAIVAWRILWLKYLNELAPEQSCTVAFTTVEWQVLHQQSSPATPLPTTPPTLGTMVRALAKLGGFIGRKGDGDPGVRALWRGLNRLTDLVTGYMLDTSRSLTLTAGTVTRTL